MRDVETALRKRKFPSEFRYGPERITRNGYFDHVIVFERDRKANDTTRPVQGTGANPNKRLVRELCVDVKVYAKSSVDGARVEDHERECEQIVDALLLNFSEWGTAARSGAFTITESRYLSAEEYTDPTKPLEAWAGAVYVIRFRVPRGVTARDYEGAARPTGAATGVSNSAEVRMNAGDPPEVVDLP